MEKKKEKKVFKEYGDVRRLAKDFNVSELTVRRALTGKTQSDLAERIRNHAKEKYNVEMVDVDTYNAWVQTRNVINNVELN